LAERNFDVVTGRFDERSDVAAIDARAISGLCGPEALLFEPRISAEVLAAPVVELAQKLGLIGAGAFGAFVITYSLMLLS
jgi:hypothetical protein